jgi:Uma2 family endonuclease
MQSLPNRLMTVDEFLPWAEAQERGRYELHDGQVITMSPERAGHWRAKAAVFIALRGAIKPAGFPYDAFPDGATVRISRRTAFEPDTLVYCGMTCRTIAWKCPIRHAVSLLGILIRMSQEF